MLAIKRTLRYLKGTENHGPQYKKSGKFELKVYTDVDWAENIDDRKSTSGGDFFLGRRLISWTSKKQTSISQSTIEAEYIVAIVNCSNIVQIKQLLKGMKEDITEPIVIYFDNTSAINISKNLVIHTKTKNIEIKQHYLRDVV